MHRYYSGKGFEAVWALIKSTHIFRDVVMTMESCKHLIKYTVHIY